jgi:glutathione synthase/RimK-type ligase-like ATP-grasp enzyme
MMRKMMTINTAKTYMFCYDPYSESGKLLANALEIRRIKHEGSTFYGNSSHLVINWGASPKRWNVKGFGFTIWNNPNAVAQCVNKTKFFSLCNSYGSEAPRIPEWTTTASVAKEWLTKGSCVIGRKLVEGMGGDGIVIMEKTIDFEECRLYTKYVPKKLEFRLYMVGTKIVDVCRKARNLDETPANWKIRSRANGFIFVHYDEADLPADVIKQVQKAMQITGLDFGGIDVIYNETQEKAYVLEVNTAPWLSESIAQKMAEEMVKAV